MTVAGKNIEEWWTLLVKAGKEWMVEMLGSRYKNGEEWTVGGEGWQKGGNNGGQWVVTWMRTVWTGERSGEWQ